MNNNDRSEFAKLWTSVRDDIYGKPVSATALDIVFRALQRFDIADIQKAIEIHINDTENGRFPIIPAHVVANIEGAGHERSAQAWNMLVGAIKHIGPYRDVVFDDPTIHAIVANEGGWLKVCDMSEEDLKFMQARFNKQYVGYVSRREFNYPQMLKGITNSENSGKKDDEGKSFEIEKPAVVGDSEKAKQTYLGGSSGKPQINHNIEVSATVNKLLVSNA